MSPLRVAYTDWTVRGGIVTKECHYSGLTDEESAHQLLIEITATRSRVTGLFEPGFMLTVRPDPLPDVTGEEITGRLSVPGSTIDTPAVPVVIDHADDGALSIAAASVQDAEAFLQTISAGVDLEFALLEGGATLIDLPIPNDVRVLDLLREVFD